MPTYYVVSRRSNRWTISKTPAGRRRGGHDITSRIAIYYTFDIRDALKCFK